MLEKYPPLLVTLKMDTLSFMHFTAMRDCYFPPDRNHIDAHITLFHALPFEAETAIAERLTDIASHTKAFVMPVTGLMFLGNGVAYSLNSPHATALRKDLATYWQDWLTPQDAQRGFKPHITVQNKVEAKIAQALHAQLEITFVPRNVTAIGLDLWYYRGGPWQHISTFYFTN